MYALSRRRLTRPLLALVLGLAAATWGSVPTVRASSFVGAVYALTNAPSGNGVVVWHRAADGTLSAGGTFATGGRGTGGGLGSQGAVILSPNHQWLFAVDAGSNEVTSFAVDRAGLRRISHVASGGLQPTSLTLHDNLLYVLNAGGSGNISGFVVGNNGTLSPLAGSERPLSGAATAPAQVGFSPDGRTLVVTERATSRIAVYRVGSDGLATGPLGYASSGQTPFGFAFDQHGQLFVSEAAGAPNGLSAASSYRLDDDGTLASISASVPTQQAAACWLVVTNSGRFAYTGNAASNSISGYRVGSDGSLTLLDLDGRTAVTGDGSGPTDLALSHTSQFLYVRNGRAGTIGAFAVQADGSLLPLPAVPGLPGGSAGLAAY